jgi:SPP1 gp7 family putative phage head morphogenesis protein
MIDDLRRARARLMREDRALLAALAADWRLTETQILREVERLLSQRTASRSWLYERQRLVIFQAAVQLVISHYVARLEARLAASPAPAWALDDAAFLVGQRALVAAELVLSPALRQILASLASDAAQGMADALVRGVLSGQNPRQIARLVAAQSRVALRRALTIARTETLRAYRETSRRAYRESGVTEWIWYAHLGPRTCAVCIAMHGTRYPVTESLRSHPNCRCAMLPVVAGVPEIETGPSWFARQNERTQLAILGPGKLAAYNDGAFGLPDLVGETPRGRFELPLREVAA